MSITDAFERSRVEFGIKQKPNWAGTVYGACMNKGCGNYKHIGYYTGGFCKLCSRRYPEDEKKPVISAPDTPNPSIKWVSKMWVKDMSHTLKPSERREFYMTPEERARALDRVIDEPEEEEE